LSRPSDRYEPLPGLLSIPGFLIRRLSPRGKRVLAVVAGLAFVAAVVAAAILIPRINEARRDNAERARLEAAATLAERRERLIAEQRPHRGRSADGSARRAVLGDLASAILADARTRVEAGDLSPPAGSRVECDALRHGQQPSDAVVRYECIAVTSDLPTTETTPAGVIGHPFRAVIDYDRGRFTWCKVSGRPGEGQFTSRALVQLPRACSG
jgi:hypothetical protein